MASPSHNASLLSKRRSFRAPFLLCLFITCLLQAKDKWRRYDFSRPEMGTVFHISMFAASEAQAKAASDAAFARIAALNQCCSDYLPDSELIQLCRAGSRSVSDDLFQVIERSQQIALLTGGAFDISIGHLSNLWRRSKRRGSLPTDEQLSTAMARTDWQAITLDENLKRITLNKPNMQLDLGGIAKGFAADAALRVLGTQGFPCAIVAASGDIAVGDVPPGEHGWEISIRTFETAEANDKLIKLRLAHCGISTSGDLHQAAEINGKRYSHIVNPKTGLGLTSRIACSVIAPDATSSDALATAMCVLGVDKGRQVLRMLPEIKARFAELDAIERIVVTTTSQFPQQAK